MYQVSMHSKYVVTGGMLWKKQHKGKILNCLNSTNIDEWLMKLPSL